MATVYDINKGINRSIEFKGIKAQYLIYLAVGLVSLLLLFAILYVLKVNIYFCLAVIIPAAIALVMAVQHFSKKYGEHGLTKKMAQRKLPTCIRTTSRNIFQQLDPVSHEKESNNGEGAAHLSGRKRLYPF
jgi:hypothetical protein